ncbi:MAG: hypothetical protein ACPH4L_07995, partial [Candidatus Puniceispirillaceae bacterium]
AAQPISCPRGKNPVDNVPPVTSFSLISHDISTKQSTKTPCFWWLEHARRTKKIIFFPNTYFFAYTKFSMVVARPNTICGLCDHISPASCATPKFQNNELLFDNVISFGRQSFACRIYQLANALLAVSFLKPQEFDHVIFRA